MAKRMLALTLAIAALAAAVACAIPQEGPIKLCDTRIIEGPVGHVHSGQTTPRIKVETLSVCDKRIYKHTVTATFRYRPTENVDWQLMGMSDFCNKLPTPEQPTTCELYYDHCQDGWWQVDLLITGSAPHGSHNVAARDFNVPFPGEVEAKVVCPRIQPE